MILRSVFNPVRLIKQTGLLVYLHADSISVIDILTGEEVDTTNKKVITDFDPTLVKTASSDDFNWQNALESLTAKLALINPKPKTPLRIVLSSDFVRYLLLPAQAIALSSAEKNAYARAAFRQLHGSIVDNWQIKCDDTAPTQASMLAAIDQQLHQNLVQITTAYQLKLVSVVPYLMQVFNGIHNQLRHFTGYLALIEGGRIILLNVKSGKIEQLKSQFIGNNWQAELNQFLDREQTLGHAINNNLLVCAPMHQGIVPFAKKSWNISHIEQSNQGFSYSPSINTGFNTTINKSKLGANA